MELTYCASKQYISLHDQTEMRLEMVDQGRLFVQILLWIVLSPSYQSPSSRAFMRYATSVPCGLHQDYSMQRLLEYLCLRSVLVDVS